MDHAAIPLEDRRGWEEALDGVPHAFWHTWDHCSAMVGATGDRTRLHVLESGSARVVCPLAERDAGDHFDFVTPYGFPGFVGRGDAPGLDARWRAVADASGAVCGYFALNPVLTDERWFEGVAQSDRDVFVFDLTQDEDALFERLDSNRRRQVRRAEGLELCRDSSRLADFFVANYPDFMARRDAAPVYGLGEASLRRLCDSRRAVLVGVEREGGVRAVSLFGFTAHAGDFIFNVSLPGEEEHSAALIWAGVRELRARGVPTLNLGAGIRPGDGIERFKERFGADRRPLRIVRQVYRPDVYAALCAEAGVDPDSAGYFPPYRARR